MEKGLRVLIVDDSELIRTIIARLLKDLTPWIVCGEARNASEAIEAAVATVPNVILLDLNLAGAGGSETIRGIRRRLPEIPIVIISAEDGNLLSEAARKTGANAWLDKNRIATDLVPTIESVCLRVTQSRRPIVVKEGQSTASDL
jgi:DNA-binding NarL/FixJ family response regulator